MVTERRLRSRKGPSLDELAGGRLVGRARAERRAPPGHSARAAGGPAGVTDPATVPDDLELLAGGQRRSLAAWPEGRDNLFRRGAVDDADALVTRRQACLQERDQDLITFLLAGEHPADVVARLGFEATDPQGDAVRHDITAIQRETIRP